MAGYRKPGKQEAYEAAQKLAELLNDERLSEPSAARRLGYYAAIRQARLTPADIGEICTKAIRVERGRRLGKGPTTHQMPLRLNESDRAKLTAIADEHGVSDAEAVRIAIRAYTI